MYKDPIFIDPIFIVIAFAKHGDSLAVVDSIIWEITLSNQNAYGDRNL